MRPASSRGRQPHAGDRQAHGDGGADAGDRREQDVAALAAEADGQQRTGARDREQEDGVEEDEEGQQRARGLLRLHAGAAQRPQREGDAAGATRGEEAGDRGAGQRDLGARAQVHTGGGSLADHPQQCDVAGERDHFEADGGEDPARIGIDRAMEGVAERVHRAAGEDQHPGRHHQRGDRQRGAAREGACVERGEVELGWGVGGEHGFNEYPEPATAFQRRYPVALGTGCHTRA